jgi:hypothetical protein
MAARWVPRVGGRYGPAVGSSLRLVVSRNFFCLHGGGRRDMANCKLKFPGLGSGQWPMSWKVVAESPGGMFIVRDWLGLGILWSPLGHRLQACWWSPLSTCLC